MDMRKYLTLFISEVREHLEESAEAISRLEESPQDAELLNLLFRHGHSIKGMAASMGFESIAEVSHALEDRFDDIRKGEARFTPGLAQRALEAVDAIGEAIDRIERDEEPPAALAELAARLRAVDDAPGAADATAPGTPDGGAAPPSSRLGPTAGEDWIYNAECLVDPGALMPAARAMVLYKKLEGLGKILFAKPDKEAISQGHFQGRLLVQFSSTSPEARLRTELESLPEIDSVVLTPFMSAEEGAKPAQPTPPAMRAAPRPVPPATPAATVRIRTDTLDRFLDHLGELTIQGSRLENALRPELDGDAGEALAALRTTLGRLRGDLMSLRMVPFEHIASRFLGSVRNLGGNLGKRVALSIHGREVKLDRSLLEDLVDPINHVLRNAVDHGIESPEERASAGKDPVGRIAIRNTEHSDSVTIEIEDDGRGMDPEHIRKAAVARNILSEEEARSLPEPEILMLVTTPGFSTAERLTEVSGRGVGMDVVRTRIESMGGRLRILSTPGERTCVQLRLPFTVAVIHAFLVRCGDEMYAVPVSSVRRTFEAPASKVKMLARTPVISLDGETVELLHLDRMLGSANGDGGTAAREGTRPALLFYRQEQPLGLVVDAVMAKRDIVVKPLRSPLENLREFSGATILEDGRIAMILDILNLSRRSPNE